MSGSVRQALVTERRRAAVACRESRRLREELRVAVGRMVILARHQRQGCRELDTRTRSG